jgi:cyanate lyase
VEVTGRTALSVWALVLKRAIPAKQDAAVQAAMPIKPAMPTNPVIWRSRYEMLGVVAL